MIKGKWDEQFVVDVFQAGAGTSQNMNANEVIANRASESLGLKKGDYSLVHPNNHVNMAQSTNDTIHAAIHIASIEAVDDRLLPYMLLLERALKKKAREFNGVVKIGRTHLQDAVPIRMGQEFSGYAEMVTKGIDRLRRARASVLEIGIGGTAVGTGLNAHPGFQGIAIKAINRITGKRFKRPGNIFEFMQNTDGVLELSSVLRGIAVSLTKIANDMRLLSSGPRAGLGEIMLPPMQPGSSIMPGKINPVLAEMLNMVCYQVIGNDQAVMMACQAAQLELNVMMPVIAHNILQSIDILSEGIKAFTEKCIVGIKVNKERCKSLSDDSTALATALNPRIGYYEAAEIAKEAYIKGKTVKDIVIEKGIMTEKEAQKILDPRRLT